MTAADVGALRVEFVVGTAGARPVDLPAVAAGAARLLTRLPGAARAGIVDDAAGRTVRAVGAGRAALLTGLMSLRAGPARPAAVGDGLRRALTNLDRAGPGRRVIVLAVPGRDAVPLPAGLPGRLRSTGTALYVVPLGAMTDDTGRTLGDAAAGSGGRIVTAAGGRRLVTVAAAFQAVAADLLHEYRVSYPSTAAGPVRVEVAGQVTTFELPAPERRAAGAPVGVVLAVAGGAVLAVAAITVLLWWRRTRYVPKYARP